MTYFMVLNYSFHILRDIHHITLRTFTYFVYLYNK